MSSFSHFFSKKFHHICVSLDVNFNESLTNDVASFEQLGPDIAVQVHRFEWTFIICIIPYLSSGERIQLLDITPFSTREAVFLTFSLS